MAVLNKIRQRSIFLIIVIALALFSFVIGDIFTNLDSSSEAIIQLRPLMVLILIETSLWQS